MSIVVHSLKDISRKQGMQKREPEGRTFRYYGYSAAHPSLYRKMPVVLYAGKIAIWSRVVSGSASMLPVLPYTFLTNFNIF